MSAESAPSTSAVARWQGRLVLATALFSVLWALGAFAPLTGGAVPFGEAGWPAAILALSILATVRRGLELEDVPFVRWCRDRLRQLGRRELWLAYGLFLVLVGGFAAHRYSVYLAHAYDLAIMDQAIWATAHGSLLFSSIKGDMVLLGDHFSPILIAFSLLYRAFDDPRVLVVVQAAILGAGAFPLLRLSRRVLGDSALAGLFPLAFLASAPLHHMALADFHPEAVAVPALLWALCFLHEGKLPGLWLAVGIVLACKETAALAVAGLGLVAILDRRRFWLGAALIAVGVGAFGAEVKLGLPHFAGHETPYTGRYAQLGNGMGEVLQAPLRHPLRVLGLLVLPARKIEGLLRLLVPFAFLSAAAPAVLAGALPNYLANAMAAYPPMHGVGFHYHAELMAFTAAAAVLGAARARNRWSSRSLALALGLCSLLQIGKPEIALWWSTPQTERHREIDRMLQAIPPEAAVSADTRTATHLAHRMKLFVFPERLDEAEYVAVDSRVVDHAWHSTPAQTQAAVASLPGRGFEKLAEVDGFLVFRKPAAR